MITTKKHAKCRPAFTLVEVILVIGIVSVIGLAVTGMVHTSYQNWELSSHRSSVFQDGQAAMEQMIRILRQAKGFDAVTESTDEAGYVIFTSVDNITEEFRLNTTTSELEYGQPGALSALAGPVSKLVFTSYDIDDNVLTGAVCICDIQAVNIEATFVNAEDNSVSTTLSGRVFIRTERQDLVGWWKLDETSGLTAADSSGNDNDGDLNGMIGNEWTAGMIRGALEFDGINAKIIIGNENSLNITNEVTLSAWVWHDAFIIGETERYVSVRSEIAVIRKENDGRLHFYIKTDGSFRHLRVSDVLMERQWHHIAGTWDGTTQRLYLDGVEIDSQTPGGVLTVDFLGVNIGSSSSPINGLLDDVRIYRCALDPTEIAALANVLRYRDFTETKAASGIFKTSYILECCQLDSCDILFLPVRERPDYLTGTIDSYRRKYSIRIAVLVNCLCSRVATFKLRQSVKFTGCA